MTGDYGVAEEPARESSEETPADDNSFLAPKDAFGGECKEGDTYTVKVVGVYGDEIELAKVEKEKEPETESTPEMRMEEMAGG